MPKTCLIDKVISCHIKFSLSLIYPWNRYYVKQHQYRLQGYSNGIKTCLMCHSQEFLSSQLKKLTFSVVLLHTLVTYSHFPGSEPLLGWLDSNRPITHLLTRETPGEGKRSTIKSPSEREGRREGERVGRRFVRIKNTLAQMLACMN